MDSMNAIPSWPRRYRVHRIHSRTRGLLYRSRRDRHDELRVQQDGGVMIARVDGLLDRITMYRLVLWYLVTLLLCALALGALHVIPIDPVALASSTVLVLAGGWIANQIFARIFGAIPNIESVYITGLIIVLIMDPAPLGELSAAGAIVFASAWAMASKFIFSLRRRHVFNPAAD